MGLALKSVGPNVQQAPLPTPAPAPVTEAPEDQYSTEAIDQLIAETVARKNARVQKTMYTPEQASERRGQNDREYQLGLLGMLSGQEGLGDAGGMVFKNALSMRTPKVGDHGTTDLITGQHTYDPDYLDAKDDAALMELKKLRVTQGEKRAATNSANVFKTALLGQKIAGQIAVKGMSGGGGGGEKADHWGMDGTTGDFIYMTKTGEPVQNVLGPSGQRTQVPYTGQAPVPKATAEKAITEATIAQSTSDGIAKMMTEIKANPDAFGLAAAASGSLGPTAAPYLAKAMGLSPATIQLRAKIVRQAALETNKLYGAALSRGEETRAKGFLISGDEPFDAAMAKLAAAREYAKDIETQSGATWSRLARQRSGNVAPPTAPPGPSAAGAAQGGLTPEEQAELAALKAGR